MWYCHANKNFHFSLSHVHDIHVHAHTPIHTCMLPKLNINLINHKNKDVTSYRARDVKMYNIYQLTKVSTYPKIGVIPRAFQV